MLALMNNAQSTELYLHTGRTVEVPGDVLERVAEPKQFKAALLWGWKAGLISHAEYLAGRDVVAGHSPVSLDMQSL